MKKIILDAVKHFVFLFLVLEIIPYIVNSKGDVNYPSPKGNGLLLNSSPD